MYLNLPNYPDPQAPGSTITAYAKINALSVDFLNNNGRLRLGIYRTLAAMAANAQPIADLTVMAGGRLLQSGNMTGPVFPTVTQIATNNATEWTNLWTYLLTNLITLNGFSGATIAP